MDTPEWLAENVNKNYPCCGHLITNNDAPTDRYCSSEKCPEHMAQKTVVLARRMGIKDLGIASAREAVRLYKFQLHTQVLPYWFKEKLSLYPREIEEICLVKEHQVKWRQYCEGHDTMMQVVKCLRAPPEIRKHAVLLICTVAMYNVKSRLLGKRLNVMLSESFDRYRSRSDFAAGISRKCGDVIQMIGMGKRKIEVAFLVREICAIDHEKSAIADVMDIPIITPKGLGERSATYKSYITEGRKGS